MQEWIGVTGIILKQTPVGEYDRRICLLTRERGKISAFVRGCRRPGSRLAGAAAPLSFGRFRLCEGRTAYSVAEAEIQNYFEELRKDYIGAYYGMYLAEIADYYGRENNDEAQMLKLLYQSLRALCAASIPHGLVRCVFEIRAMAVNGEFPVELSEAAAGDPLWKGLLPPGEEPEDSTRYALAHITGSPIEKLYTFAVSDRVFSQLEAVSAAARARVMDRKFKSLEILETLG